MLCEQLLLATSLYIFAVVVLAQACRPEQFMASCNCIWLCNSDTLQMIQLGIKDF